MVSPKDQFYDPYNKILQSSPLCGWHWSMCIWNLQSISGMIIFKSIQKEFEGDLKIKLHVKDYPAESIKYLGVKIDTNLSY